MSSNSKYREPSVYSEGSDKTHVSINLGQTSGIKNEDDLYETQSEASNVQNENPRFGIRREGTYAHPYESQ